MKTIQEIANELGYASSDAHTGALKVIQALEDLEDVIECSLYSEVALCELRNIIELLVDVRGETDEVDECVTRLQMLDCEYIIGYDEDDE